MERREPIEIEIDAQLGSILEERGIEPEDIRGVLAAAAPVKNLFRNCATEHTLAYYRASRTTYWVEYGRQGNRYRIYSAYSHRMEIMEGFNLPAKERKTIPDWICVPCGVFLEMATVKLTYLDETFAAETPACPSCQRVFVREADAVEKMALAEKMLEDK
jgi:hypothetical protein